MPTIRKALIENGSPLANFEMDDDRIFFEATLFIHEAFSIDQKSNEKRLEKAPEKVGKSSERIRNDFGKSSERIRNKY
jgi:hypothetical protein